MKVSVITVCLNRETTIRDTIESVLSQDYPDVEYILIDGASTDSTLSIIQEYKDRVSIILSEPDKGMYEALNKGIRLASGDIVGMLHSDDLFCSATTLSDIVKEFRHTDADFLYGNGLFVSQNNANKVIRNWISGPYDRNKVRTGWLPLHPTCYIRRKCLIRYGLYDENFKIASDSDFLVHYMYEVPELKICYLNQYIVRIRMGGLSTTIGNYRQIWREDIRLYKKHHFMPVTVKLMKMYRKLSQFVSPVDSKAIFPPVMRLYDRMLKRTFDIIVSLSFLCTLFFPFFCILGIAIKITSKGPILFRQKHYGQNGKIFTCIKFRTMSLNAEAPSKAATQEDSRITRLGHFLRETYLDKLPQFINVLKGDMSIIGPHPHTLCQTEEYSLILPEYRQRLLVKPGITGLAQIEGGREEIRTRPDLIKRTEWDIWYVKHWTFGLDLRIFFRTLFLFLCGGNSRKTYAKSIIQI